MGLISHVKDCGPYFRDMGRTLNVHELEYRFVLHTWLSPMPHQCDYKTTLQPKPALGADP